MNQKEFQLLTLKRPRFKLNINKTDVIASGSSVKLFGFMTDNNKNTFQMHLKTATSIIDY